MKTEYLTVGGDDGMCTRLSLRCTMRKAHDSLSSAGEMGEVAAVGMVRRLSSVIQSRSSSVCVPPVRERAA